MKYKTTLAAIAVAGVVIVSGGAVVSPAWAEQADEDGVRRFTVACDKPGKTANYSFDDDNDQSVTVYFNNHCNHKVRVSVHIELITPYPQPSGYTECLTTNGGTKGKKKFWFPGTYHVTKLTRGC